MKCSKRSLSAQARAVSSFMNLTTMQPVIPRKNVLLIEGIHDLICPRTISRTSGRRVGFAFRSRAPRSCKSCKSTGDFPACFININRHTIPERQLMFRKSILWLHRWTGLAITAFIIVMAVTGTILAFHAELDRMLNPALMTVPVRDAPLLDAVALRDRAAAMEPHAPFEYFYLKVTPGQSFCLSVVRAKTDPSTGKPYDLGFDQLFLDPYTGEKVGSRNSSHSLIPFLFNLHYGMTFGNRGVRLFGFISLVWTITSIIGIYLTFPLRRRRSKTSEQKNDTPEPPGRSWWRRWMPAWKIKGGGGTYRMSYDIHRAFGLWTWLLLFIFAWSGVALNLPAPYMKTMSFLRLTVRNSVGEHLKVPEKPPGPPALDWRAALERGRVLIRETGLKEGYTVREEVLHAGGPPLRRLSIRRDKLQGPARRGDSGCGSFHRRKQRRAARSLVTVEVPPRHHHYEMAGRVAHGNLPWTADENPDLPLRYYHHRALRHGRDHLVEEA